MVTLVGMQSSFADALYELLELEYDALEAYDSAINRLENSSYKAKLKEFHSDHERHITNITNLLKKHNHSYPTGPSAKKILTKGKVILADLVGDNAILKAMLTNEEDTNSAYERMVNHEGKWKDSENIMEENFHDERRHKKWIKSQIS